LSLRQKLGIVGIELEQPLNFPQLLGSFSRCLIDILQRRIKSRGLCAYLDCDPLDLSHTLTCLYWERQAWLATLTVRLTLSSDFHLYDFLASRALDFHFSLTSSNKQFPVTQGAPNLFHTLCTPLHQKLVNIFLGGLTNLFILFLS